MDKTSWILFTNLLILILQIAMMVQARNIKRSVEVLMIQIEQSTQKQSNPAEPTVFGRYTMTDVARARARAQMRGRGKPTELPSLTGGAQD